MTVEVSSVPRPHTPPPVTGLRRAGIRRIARVAIAVAALGVAAGVVVPSALAATQTTFFVSPSGDDTNSGTSSSSPVRTLARAQALVRGVNGAMTGDVKVQLTNGTYQLSAPLTLGASDSGTNGHNVIWTAASGARPVLSGAVRVSGWTQFDAAK